MFNAFVKNVKTDANNAVRLHLRWNLPVASVMVVMLTLATFGTSVIVSARELEQELEYALQSARAIFLVHWTANCELIKQLWRPSRSHVRSGLILT